MTSSVCQRAPCERDAAKHHELSYPPRASTSICLRCHSSEPGSVRLAHGHARECSQRSCECSQTARRCYPNRQRAPLVLALPSAYCIVESICGSTGERRDARPALEGCPEPWHAEANRYTCEHTKGVIVSTPGVPRHAHAACMERREHREQKLLCADLIDHELAPRVERPAYAAMANRQCYTDHRLARA